MCRDPRIGRSLGKFPVAATVSLALWLAGGGAALAAEEPAAPAVEKPPLARRIDVAHQEQEVFFGELFDRIDRVFGEQYVDERERKAQVRVGGETTFNDEGTSIDTALNVALRIPLPTLERRLNLFLDVGGDVNELGSASNPNFADAQRNLSLGAGVVGRLREEIEGGFKVNLFWDDGAFTSVYPFLRFERRRAPLRYFLEQRLVWDTDNAWNTRTDLDIDRTLGGDFFLRFRNRVDYVLHDPGAHVAHGLILRQSVFSTSGLSYEVWMEYDTAADDPESLSDDTIAYAQVRWRGRVWREWLEYELRPVYTRPFENKRDSFFSFFVSLTVIWHSHVGRSLEPPVETWP